MSKYHLVDTATKETFFNLTRLEMVSKLREISDLQNWFCWYPGLAQWKIVSQAYEVKEWMSVSWTEDQPVPPWEFLINRKAGTTTPGDFEVVEFGENSSPTPPPIPNPTDKTEFVISGFSGQVFDFDESLKDKHFKSDDFKISNVPNTSDLEKPDSNSTYDNTSKIEAPVTDETIATDLGDPTVAGKNTASIQAFEESTQKGNTGAAKKHNRRYPRIKGRLRTIITNKSKAFMTFTKDISLGGIYVENLIPQDILNSEIEVYLSDPTGKKSILFRCLPVGDLKNPCRFSFAKADEKNIQKLSQWINDLEKIGAA